MATIDPSSLAAGLRRLRPSDGEELLAGLDLVVSACVDLFGVTGSGLMIADEQDMLRYVAASDGPGRALEAAQTETGQGPCVDTFVDDALTETADMATDPRWPASRDTIAAHGVRAVLGVPVHLGGIPVGSLDVYRDRPHHWTDPERAALRRYAAVVGTTLETAMAARRAGELADQLQYALDNRIVIERAIGFLMARHGLTAVPAFTRLRRAARDDRRRIGEIARDVLENNSLL